VLLGPGGLFDFAKIDVRSLGTFADPGEPSTTFLAIVRRLKDFLPSGHFEGVYEGITASHTG
jgi:hypothetical protein